jgi:catechol 2,3-dioxygenase-like lactoylglutathione lyase family enzyme
MTVMVAPLAVPPEDSCRDSGLSRTRTDAHLGLWQNVAMSDDAPHFGSEQDGDHPDREDEWDRMRGKYLLSPGERPASSARGVHHQALISSDVERTIAFYQGLLEFPMTELFQNRDYVGSTHFFFDIGNGNALAFFDFPGLGLEEYQEVLGGHHHLAISMPRDNWERVRGKLEAAGVEVFLAGGTSMYFVGPDGERLELISDPLGEMYGNQVL